MQEFGALFDDVKFKKGLQLNFTSGKDGALITQVDNKQVNCRNPLTVVQTTDHIIQVDGAHGALPIQHCPTIMHQAFGTYC